MGKYIFLDCAIFDAIFDISCSRFTTSSKKHLSSNFDMSFKYAKLAIDLNNFDSLPSGLGPKHLSFKIYVIAHIMAMTLHPRVGSLSTLS